VEFFRRGFCRAGATESIRPAPETGCARWTKMTSSSLVHWYHSDFDERCQRTVSRPFAGSRAWLARPLVFSQAPQWTLVAHRIIAHGAPARPRKRHRSPNRRDAESLALAATGGGANWAIIASLIETAKLNGVSTQAWLADTQFLAVAGCSGCAFRHAVQVVSGYRDSLAGCHSWRRCDSAAVQRR
jgi:hypothetical protein